MSKLSAKAVEKALPKQREYKLADGGGLFLRIRTSGAKSWLFSFRLPGSRTVARMTIGSLEDLSLKEVRDKLPKLRKLVAEGIDPRNERAAVKAENTQAITMQTLFDAWLESIMLTKTMNLIWAKRHADRWRTHLKKPLGILLVRDVSRAHLAAALDAMARKGIKEETRKALTTLNLMMDYALTRHFIEQNPARMLKPKDFAATANRPRDRALTLVELGMLWQAIDKAILIQEEKASSTSMAITTAIAIKLLILTGARRGEIAGMRWAELNLESGIWLLPSSRTKNGQAHTIYLSDLAISLIKTMPLSTRASLFVFDTGRGAKKGHIKPDSLSRALDRLRKSQKSELADLKPFTVHDLRRSAATSWGEHLKIDPHIIERMLNHLPLNKLMATYQRAIYADEQRMAWVAWGILIEQQVAYTTKILFKETVLASTFDVVI